jgi:hypothetical protein
MYCLAQVNRQKDGSQGCITNKMLYGCCDPFAMHFFSAVKVDG